MPAKRSGLLQSGTHAVKKNGWVSVLSPTQVPGRAVPASYESAIFRSAVLLAAGTIAFVGFAACASVLGRKRLPPPPGKALRFARRELRRLAAPRRG